MVAVCALAAGQGLGDDTQGLGQQHMIIERSSLDMESTFLARNGRQPTSDEITSYLERHQLQSFLTEVIMYVARHMPLDPFEFLLDHMETLVVKHRTSHDLFEGSSPKTASAFGSPAVDAIKTEFEDQSPERRCKVVRHLATALQSEQVAGASAAKLFDQYAVACEDGDGAVLPQERFAEMAERLQDSWGLQPGDVHLMLQTFQRWRFQKNVTSKVQGVGVWPMVKEDFVEAFPRVLRQVRDHYVPIGGRLHRSLFIRRAAGVMSDRYTMGSKLGQGAFGEVFIVSLKADRAERRVCKRVARTQQRVPCEELQGEVNLLRALDHPHVTRLYEFFESEDWLDMIIEPAFGGSLLHLLHGMYRDAEGNPINARPEKLSEAWVATAMSQLLSALAYAHNVVGVIHKDVKPDNVLLVGRPGVSAHEQLQEPLHVMLADFGIAELFTERVNLASDEDLVEKLCPGLGVGSLGFSCSGGSAGSTTAATSSTAGTLTSSSCTSSSHSCTRKELRSSRVGGTPPYMSPEMFTGSFTEKSDVWSLGVVLFQLMLGELPYRADNILMQANLVCNPRRHPPWHRLAKFRWSLGARWFCQQLLLKDEQQRPSASAAARDTWLLKAAADHATEPPTERERNSLNQQHLQSHLMKMAMGAVTSQLNLSRLHHLNLRFKHYDKSGDGRLSHEEMQEALQELGVPLGDDPELIIEALDGDRSGYIEYSEFVSGCLDLASDGMREHLRAAFEVFDLDGSGCLTYDELRQVLTQGPNASAVAQGPLPPALSGIGLSGAVGLGMLLPDGRTVEEVMKSLDVDGSGKVTFEEFQSYLFREHEQVGQELHTKQSVLTRRFAGVSK